MSTIVQFAKDVRHNPTKLLTYFFLVIFSVIMILPFFWLVTSSFKAPDEIFTVPIKWLPESFGYLDNYERAFTSAPFGKFYYNSLKIATLRIIGVLFFSSLCAFSFAKLRFKGKNIIFLFILGTLMLPAQVTIIPTYYLMTKLSWVNTHLPLIVPLFFDGFVVFMLRQFFLTIPDSLLDAAKIDGAGYLYTFFTVIIPLSKPALASVSMLIFIWSWNDILGPLIFINSQHLLPISLGMNVFKQTHNTLYGPLFAGSVIAQIPLLIVFVAGQKYFQQGIATTGIKG